MSAFTEQLAKQPEGKRGPGCPVAIVLANIDDASANDIIAALKPTSGWQGTQIARALVSMGHPIKKDSVQAHRRGDCRCA